MPSGIRPLPCVARTELHRLVLPEVQNLQVRHSAVYSGITWSPTCTEVTLANGFNNPAAFVAQTAGNTPSESSPDRVYASVWHTPVATIRTKLHRPWAARHRFQRFAAAGLGQRLRRRGI